MNVEITFKNNPLDQFYTDFEVDIHVDVEKFYITTVERFHENSGSEAGFKCSPVEYLRVFFTNVGFTDYKLEAVQEVKANGETVYNDLGEDD